MAAGFLESVEGNEPGGRAAQIRNKLSRGEAKYLEAIDRYEPASVVRRKFATQAFDAA
jgi:hypothetical protein